MFTSGYRSPRWVGMKKGKTARPLWTCEPEFRRGPDRWGAPRILWRSCASKGEPARQRVEQAESQSDAPRLIRFVKHAIEARIPAFRRGSSTVRSFPYDYYHYYYYSFFFVSSHAFSCIRKNTWGWGDNGGANVLVIRVIRVTWIIKIFFFFNFFFVFTIFEECHRFFE